MCFGFQKFFKRLVNGIVKFVCRISVELRDDGFIGDTLSMTLMTVFFVILLLSESINFQLILNSTIFKVKHASVKTFIKIERDILKFVIVKFFISRY